MNAAQQLEQEYFAFLRSSGVSLDDLRVAPEDRESSIQAARRRDVEDGMEPRTYAGVRSAKGPNDLYQHFSSQIISASAQSPTLSTTGIEIYTGVFPTGSINAQARSAKAGCLVLLNTGLLGFLQNFVGILLRYNHVQDRLFREEFSSLQSERLEQADVVVALSELLASFMGPPRLTWPKDRYVYVGGYMAMIYHTLMNACLQFILCHEHAHIARGHLKVHKQMRALFTPVGQVEFAEKSWLEELEADYYGTYLLVFSQALAANMQSNPERLGDLARFLYAGIAIFFAMDGLIATAYECTARELGVAVPVVVDHPPANVRDAEARRYFVEGHANESVFELAEWLLGPLKAIEAEIATRVASRLRATAGR